MLQLFDAFPRHWVSSFDFDFFDRELNRRFPAFQQAGRAAAHPVNLYLADEGARVVAEVPGWRAEHLDISVDGNKLHLAGRIPSDQKNPLSLGDFQRVVNLPFRIREDQVSAELQNGRLTIALERREEDKPKRIQVNVA
ncbi:Hsp20/alpha crystallin family protein [Acanthopleuribacter pedis]|uniref:Hsp20/alpha crystallin family protein n=1 Tax=Acanthopleuribacter pedis TaxID=442870 RepID=A0A8J7QG25_9BACT|nr:Hsp20/alpha crystallin family protein [Acanthopleuribacter pedis]MBO1317933.1 Hsp20/alpha crystallin family protein [Acanthopleuribacter pedis]